MHATADAFVCINPDTQEFIPFDEYVRLEVAQVCEELGRMCDQQGAPAGHPLREKALADVAGMVEAAMRQQQAAQIEAYAAAMH